MEKRNMKNQKDLFCEFMDTVGTAFRILSLCFISVNYIMAMVGYLSGKGSQDSMYVTVMTSISLSSILLIAFIEPYTYGRYKKLNVFINVLIALCCGTLFFVNKSYIILAVFFTCMVTVSLKLSVIKSVIISLIYYIFYMAAVVYGSVEGTDAVAQGVQVLVVLLSAVYLCQYLMTVEKRKIRQEDTVTELLNEKVSLTKALNGKSEELEQVYWDMVNTLIDVIEAKDTFTGGHSIKVCEYSIKLAQKLGLKENDITKVMKASMLHDIGKMGIPDNILLKPDALTDDEYGKIKSHPELGCRILDRVKGLEDVLPMIRSHHERIDGRGYPNGLDDGSIPAGAKIIAIADAYDAMTSNRPYRKALAKKEARRRLLEGAGTQFDAEYVDKFIDVIDSDNVERISSYRRRDIREIRDYAGIM